MIRATADWRFITENARVKAYTLNMNESRH
jgi:hypothetical protein